MIKNARLYMSRGDVLFEGMIPHTLDHGHHALEIFIGLEGSMNVISGQQMHRGQVLVPDSNVLHPDHFSGENSYSFALCLSK